MISEYLDVAIRQPTDVGIPAFESIERPWHHVCDHVDTWNVTHVVRHRRSPTLKRINHGFTKYLHGMTSRIDNILFLDRWLAHRQNFVDVP